MRIVSTVPSQTELLSFLGLEDEIVGITKFCIHPESVYRSKPRIGGTKDPKIEKILELNPDLIIANKEENEKAQIEALSAHCPVHVSDVYDLESALQMIQDVGELTGRSSEADRLVADIREGFSSLRESRRELGRALYLIWKDPYMAAGGDTFIHDMMHRMGLENVLKDAARYPEVLTGAFSPEYVLLSSEPYPFKEKHLAELRRAWPNSKIQLVDGEYFSWYGPRMLNAPAYFEALSAQLSA